MSLFYWVAAMLFIVACDGFVRREYCKTAPARFWLNLWETALVLIGLGVWPYLTAEGIIYLITP